MNLVKKFVISGAGSGIGRAVAVQLSKVSFSRLILIDRDQQGLDETLAQLPDSDRAELIVTDLTENDARSILSMALGTTPIDGVVAAAGIQVPSTIEDDNAWTNLFDGNFHATRRLVEVCLPNLSHPCASYRNIILISSAMAKYGVPGFGAYSASKAALESLTRSLAAEYGKRNILVNAIAPGWVNTPMLSVVLRRRSRLERVSEQDLLDGLKKMAPTLRISEAGEIAALVAFLLSGQQQSINGQVIQIDNGIGLMPQGL